MKKKLVFFVFVLCLIKLFHIKDRSLVFSSDILFNFYKKNVAEKESLGNVGVDIIPIRDFFVKNNIKNFRFTSSTIKNHELYFQRLIEFAYPIKVKNEAKFLVSHNSENKVSNCKVVQKTHSFNIYECK